MLDSKTRARAKATGFFAFLALVLVVGFQNCGPGFAPANFDGRIGLASSAPIVIPEIRIDLKPDIITNQASHTFQVSLSGPSASAVTIYCRLDDSVAFSPCPTPLTFTTLDDGVHELSLKAADASGNESRVVQASWTQDRSAPTVKVNQSPAAVIGVAQATIDFSASDSLTGIAGYECSFDNGAFKPCTSPMNITNLAQGAHTLLIRASDNAKNVSANATVGWTVTLGVPTVSITAKPPAVSNLRTASFTFTGVDGTNASLTRFECKRDAGAFAACTSPQNLTGLMDGTRTFEVRGTDSQNRVSSPVSYSWVVDGTPPVLAISSGPTGTIAVNTASFVFSATEAGSGIKTLLCQLDSSAEETCTTSKSYSNLVAGAHTFRLKATDNAGNASQLERAFTYTPPAPTPPPALDGKVLYANNCATCHGPLDSSAKINRTVAQIQGAIATIPAMVVVKGLTAAEIQAIANALSKPVGDPLQNPFVCNANSDPSPAKLRRLTRREFINTLLDLFAGQLTTNEIQAELSFMPVESLDARPAINLFDSMNPAPTNLKLIKSYNDVAAKVADVITASATKMNAIGGNACISQATVTDTCLDGFLVTFGLKTYRRPLTAEEKTSYVTLYRTGSSSPDRMARVIETMLQSPQFLFMIEADGTPINGRADLLQLSSYEIASRLSYAILGSMPDSALFTAAAAGTLNTPANIQAQVDRLIALPKARENIRHFYAQWLRLEHIPAPVVSTAFANGIDAIQFRAEAKQEIVDLVDHLTFTQRANFPALMTSNLAFVKGPNLAKIYGVAASTQPQTLSDPNRQGLLTRAGLLAMSEIGTPDPIKRGVRMRSHILCSVLGAPPNDADAQAAPVDPLSSTREQFATKTSPSQCMTCHARINPLGFAFGHFDGFGRYITQETITYNGQSRTHTIDAGVIPAISSPSEPKIYGASELQAEVAKNSMGHACIAQQWMQSNTGRPVEPGDSCALFTMYDSLTRPNGSLLDMFKSLMGTASFRNKKIAP